ncbi:acetyl-CoA/propionyl-CoA carboxylase, biotin carboxylase, biotin carboxyl carrier protein [Cellulosimicrobium aquatile]|uniref:biotin carboxylase n=1 Tax=Cellulosimicrobium aquatile TaxID=1612203 RepID=A0A1N6NVM8_9MICO|nr:biotin carboxylase N-terminal domain-containing protein [Cellulosimicrobium aquatile]SIP96056.1 acetyl-CoA/propionyl-CoA carboxylase, biotin carboxylase, biotin carboxyl carrier protein [Cellulosimicrobium aquatile]
MTSRTLHDATARPTGGPGFRTVLVANRGEIACRVIGTLRRLGVRSVAVFSDADADARHVREADVAVRLGPAPAAQSYLDVDAVVAAAVATGAEAVHPGYGFLSENPALARACERAGIAFVGPGVDALEAMADKLAAKSIVGARGVPVVPGAGEPGMSDDDLLAAAGAVGFPLLVKPSAGGGGKGMVVVRAEADLPGALASARRVAASSFGDDTLLLERLVEAPRHIEVQVLADTHGTVVHLGERECSLQRRHQKVVEEAPSPLLTAEQRARMGEAACEVARSVGYVGAGTVEFLVPAASPDEFFFIEMNTRLQVEHPVTEIVTGLDLVALQLRVAAGEPLGLAQSDVVLRGHAVEARLYAESPDRGFLPATGSVLVYDDGGVPSGPGASPLRLDSGISAAAVVGGHYDPMLAKAVAWGETRDEAVERLDGLLARTVVLGVETNTAFLRSLLADDDVRAGRLDTGLIDRLVASVVGPGEGPGGPDWVDLVAAALFLVEQAVVARPGGGTGHSRLLAAGMAAAGDPWRVGDGWRLNGGAAPRRVLLVDAAGSAHEVRVSGVVGDAVVHVPAADDGAWPGSTTHAARASLVRDPGADGAWWLTLDGVRERVRLALDAPPADGEPATVWVWRDGRTVALAAPDREQRAARARADRRRARGDAPGATDPEVRAAMPGTVVTVAADGEPVTAGDVLVTVEAMKMEHPLLAPHDGVADVRVRPGDLVRRDQVVAVVHPHDSGAAQPAAPVPQPDTQGAS